jgi:hypothetical protein|tara:strand:+ start:686 stop:925 length:240 start_codon:yes stop_codon:yes gene_type:complete
MADDTFNEDMKNYVEMRKLEKEQQLTVKKALESQGARHSRDKIDALTADLIAGGKPKTYAERFAQMALITAGHISKESE